MREVLVTIACPLLLPLQHSPKPHSVASNHGLLTHRTRDLSPKMAKKRFRGKKNWSKNKKPKKDRTPEEIRYWEESTLR